jgi:hypothetical protein
MIRMSGFAALPDHAIEAQSISMYRAAATCINLSVCDGPKFSFIPLRRRDALPSRRISLKTGSTA